MDKAKGGPTVFISQREMIGPLERTSGFGKAIRVVCEYMAGNAPALLAYFEIVDEVNPDKTWSLRVFNDLDEGFNKHLSWPILLLIIRTSGMYVKSPFFDYAVTFTSQEMISGIIRSFAANAVYHQYIYETNKIGPLPDMAKGFS